MEDFSRCGHLNVRDLHKRQFEKERDRQKIYDSLLTRCHSKILSYSKCGATTCLYQVPNFVYGLPIYSQSIAYEFVTQRLMEQGFKILHLPNCHVHISWELSDSNSSASTQQTTTVNNNNLPYKSKGHFL